MSETTQRDDAVNLFLSTGSMHGDQFGCLTSKAAWNLPFPLPACTCINSAIALKFFVGNSQIKHSTPAQSKCHLRYCVRTSKKGKASFVSLYPHYLLWQEAAQPTSFQCSGKHCSCSRCHLFGHKVFAMNTDLILLLKHRGTLGLDSWETQRQLSHMKHVYVLFRRPKLLWKKKLEASWGTPGWLMTRGSRH